MLHARLIFLRCAAGLLVSFAAAGDIYVDNVLGDDVLDGSSTAVLDAAHGPFRTITRALREQATPGSHIILANSGQPYRESVSMVGSRHSNSSSQPFTIEGRGAVMDGSTAVPTNAWQWVRDDVFSFQPQRKQYQQLFVNSAPAVRAPEKPFQTKVPSLEPMQWA